MVSNCLPQDIVVNPRRHGDALTVFKFAIMEMLPPITEFMRIMQKGRTLKIPLMWSKACKPHLT